MKGKLRFIISLGILLAFITVFAKQDEFVINPYTKSFEKAYALYPNLPKGILEAVSYTQTRFYHLKEEDQNSCIGIPKSYGVMGLCLDGQDYFRNNLNKIAELSKISKTDLIENPESNILAYAAALNNLSTSKKQNKNRPQDFIEQLIALSELPLAQNIQDDYAMNSFVYSVLWFLNNPVFQNNYNFPNYQIDLAGVFGQQNFEVLSSSFVTIKANQIQSKNGASYVPGQNLYSVDYGPALSNFTTCNYSGRGGTAISAVTIHDVEGTYSGCISWFKNCNSNVSAHYVLRSSDGQVTQMVLESNKGWHVGSENPYTIGLEHEGYRNQNGWYTVAMYNGSADLVKDICNSGYGISPLRAYNGPGCNDICTLGSCVKIKGHQHYPNQNHNDPGPKWDWYYYYNLLNNAPTITTLTATTGNFYDSGGASGNYANDERSVTLINPAGTANVSVTFSQFNLETNWDYLYVYDGTTTSSPLIGRYTGTTNPGTITSTNGALLFDFRSDCATITSGWQATWNSGGTVVVTPSTADTINPTTQVNLTSNWTAGNIQANFNDIDNVGGSGLEKSFYQVLEYNGNEFRANANSGFFSDNFDSIINPEWTIKNGSWAIDQGYLHQTDTVLSNTNIYSSLKQNLSNRYIYNWAQKFGGVSYAGANRRAGFHIMADAPDSTNRGNSYFVWFRLDNDKIQIYKSVNNSWGSSPSYDSAFSFNPGYWYDVKVMFDRITGWMHVYIDNKLAARWHDTSPLAAGNFISFRTANCDYMINNFKVYRSRYSNQSITVSVGAATTNDIRFQNANPAAPAGRIKSIVVDSVANLSGIASQDVNVDWTPPSAVSIVNDGPTSDIQKFYKINSLAANWSTSTDANSGIKKYWYCVGTTVGDSNVVAWKDNWIYDTAYVTGLSLTPSQIYYFSVRAENGAGLYSTPTSSNGQLLVYDTIKPITNFTVPTNYFIQNFDVNFSDVDNAAGSGLKYALYAVNDIDSLEIQRANAQRGFAYDGFNETAIKPDWTLNTGTWSIQNEKLNQSNEALSNTNIYTYLNQNLADVYSYEYNGSISGAGTNRRAGFHFMIDEPDSSQRNNSYFVWFRLDDDKIQLYKVINNSWGNSYVKDTAYNFTANTIYHFRILYHKITGVVNIYVNYKLACTWKDLNPITAGDYVSFRSGNCNYTVDNFKTYKSRNLATPTNIKVGAGNANDIRFQNPSVNVHSGLIYGFSVDSADNISDVVQQQVNVDWTPPTVITKVIDGPDALDADSIAYTGNQLVVRWDKSFDKNSGIQKYLYCVGSSQGDSDIIAWRLNSDTLVSLDTLMHMQNTMYLCAKAVNNANLISFQSCDDGFKVVLLVGLKEQFNSFDVNPNPFINSLTINLTDAIRYPRIQLLDITGRVVLNKELLQATQINLDLSAYQLSTGIYFFKLYDGDDLKGIKKIMKRE